MGIAVLGTLGMAVYRSEVVAAMPAGVPAELVQSARDTLGGAAVVAGQLSDQLGTALLQVARESFVDGLHLTSTIGTIGFTVLAILVAILLRHISAHSEAQEQAEPMALEPRPTLGKLTDAQVGD
ncbi:MAG: hypothetical protein U0528_08620 [Anaerolineae bacterium]